MANKFSDLRSRMSPQAQARAGTKAQAMLAEMPLNELRQARGLSQKMLAEVLNAHLAGFSHDEWQQLVHLLQRVVANGDALRDPPKDPV